MLESFFEWLQQLDLSAFGDPSEIDWTNIATYGTVLLAVGGAIWTSSKNFMWFLWAKTEGLVGFVISTLVVFSLWYGLLRVHVSISFNLDKEVFDDFLWLSALLFTPYYLVHYRLLKGFLLSVVRAVELVLDLIVFSWFPEKAEANRTKWRNRVNRVYTASKNSLAEFWKIGLEPMREGPTPFGLKANNSSDQANIFDDTSQDLV